MQKIENQFASMKILVNFTMPHLVINTLDHTCPSSISCVSVHGTNFTKGLWADNWHFMKIIITVMMILKIQWGHKFAHAMTAELPWHVQSCYIIGSLLLISERHIYSLRSWTISCSVRTPAPTGEPCWPLTPQPPLSIDSLSSLAHHMFWRPQLLSSLPDYSRVQCIMYPLN